MMFMKKSYRIAWKSALIVPIVVLLMTVSATAASVTINWTANHPHPEGYRVFARRVDQGFNYSLPDWEGRETACTIHGLEDNMDYYFVVQAFDDYLEGDYSAEIHYSPPENSEQENEFEEAAEPSDQQGREGLIAKAFPNDGSSQPLPLAPIPLSSEFHVQDRSYLLLNLENQEASGANPPAATHWQVYDAESEDCVLDLITDRQLFELRVSNLPFDDHMSYHWRARFFNHNGSVSDWSETSFLMIAPGPDDDREKDRPT